MNAHVGRFALTAVLVAALPAVADEARVETLAVRYRSAEDLALALRPLAGPDGVVTTAAGRLVVRASPAALAEIKRALAEMDTPPRSLRVTVKQDTEVSTSARSGDVTVETREGATVERRTSRTVVGGSLSGDRSDLSSRGTEWLQVLEGSRAFIRVGRSVPATETQIIPSAGGLIVAQGTVYFDADLGFYAVPRVFGDQVTLEISTSNDTVDGQGLVDVQHAHTTVSGRLGEWLSVGEAVRTAVSRSSGILSGRAQRFSEIRNILVKVEDAR